jgi:hypothetical protein
MAGSRPVRAREPAGMAGRFGPVSCRAELQRGGPERQGTGQPGRRAGLEQHSIPAPTSRHAATAAAASLACIRQCRTGSGLVGGRGTCAGARLARMRGRGRAPAGATSSAGARHEERAEAMEGYAGECPHQSREWRPLTRRARPGSHGPVPCCQADSTMSSESAGIASRHAREGVWTRRNAVWSSAVGSGNRLGASNLQTNAKHNVETSLVIGKINRFAMDAAATNLSQAVRNDPHRRQPPG